MDAFLAAVPLEISVGGSERHGDGSLEELRLIGNFLGLVTNQIFKN